MILLKFKKEIKGDASATGFEGQIKLLSTQFSAARMVAVPSGSAARETGSPSFSEVSCSKSFDIASSELFMQSVSGASLEEASLTYLQTDGDGGPQVFLVVTLTDPIITSYSHSGSMCDKPMESFTLNFAQIKLEYTQYTGEAAVKASPKGWNLLEQKAA
jgi:type VI secretion system secreted protein Hcp